MLCGPHTEEDDEEEEDEPAEPASHLLASIALRFPSTTLLV